MISRSKAMIIGLLGLSVCNGIFGTNTISIEVQTTSIREKQTEDEDMLDKVGNGITSVGQNIVSPIVKGTVVALSYFAGTEGLSRLAEYSGLKYSGFLKFIGTVGSVAIGLSAISGRKRVKSDTAAKSWLRLGLGFMSTAVVAIGAQGIVHGA